MRTASARLVRLRHGVALVAVLGVEGWLYREYAALGTQFHFWLHLLLGGYLGLALLTTARLVRPLWQVRGHEAAFFGHVWSAAPDVVFLSLGLLHAYWMDAFALHITAHVLWPSPLLVALALWGLAVLALLLVRLGRRRGAGLVLGGSLVLLGGAVVLHTPIPSTLNEVRELQQDGGLLAALREGRWTCTATGLAGVGPP